MTAEEGYKLIPMSEITDEAREIAVRWMECDDKDWIGQKHKLASDIMNYAKKYAAQQSKMPTRAECEKKMFEILSQPSSIGKDLRGIRSPAMMMTEYSEWLRNQIER